MNQQQRQYLIDQVTNTCNAQQTELKSQIPERPSLNNYLIAAFLDSTIKFKKTDELRDKLKADIIKYGTSEKLVNERSHYSHDRYAQYIQIDPNDLLVIPKTFTKELDIFQKIKTRIQKEIDVLEAHKKTVIMKIQIGSSKMLDKVVSQVDNLGELNLMDTRLQLTDGNE